MLEGKTVCVVVPAYNEESQILHVVQSMPAFVDRIVVVNDRSSDNTLEVLKEHYSKAERQELVNSESPVIQNSSEIDYHRATRVYTELLKTQSEKHLPRNVIQHAEKKLVIIDHEQNGGVGAAIASGYFWARENRMDCTAVMAGDGQMDPDELRSICMPVVRDGVDYAKGNRLKHPAAIEIVPKSRLFGNSVLSILTKIASGYWRVSDTQTGFTAISLRALEAIKLNRIYARYGMPNDLLVKLNIQNCSVSEIVIKPIYEIGEKSKMRIANVIPTIGLLLFKSFWRRIFFKYFVREFHPLFLLYIVGGISLLISSYYFVKISYLWITRIREINELTILAFLFTFLFGFQSLLFAMWMDIQDNDRLYK